ncbi:MAG: hypothetical protein C4293_09355 [Nitrospiraceae bacterium]
MDRELTPQLAVGTYIDFNVKFLLIFGFAFELPLVLTLLSRVGVVSPEVLARYRKHAIMAALIVSAVVTPDATLFTMLLMAVPLMILYELGIWGARLFGRRPWIKRQVSNGLCLWEQPGSVCAEREQERDKVKSWREVEQPQVVLWTRYP